MLVIAGFRFGEVRGDRSRARRRSGCVSRGALQCDDDNLAIDAGVITKRLGQIQHHAGAIAGLHDVHIAQVAVADFLCVLAHGIGSARKVEGDPGWIVDRKSRRRVDERIFEGDAYHGVATLLARNVDCLDVVRRARCGRLCGGNSRHSADCDGQCNSVRQPGNGMKYVHGVASCSSCAPRGL